MSGSFHRSSRGSGHYGARMVVEGEPGIFPAPVAGVLRAFGRLFTGRRRRRAEEEPTEPEAEPAD
jgi:hypothetical protein